MSAKLRDGGPDWRRAGRVGVPAPAACRATAPPGPHCCGPPPPLWAGATARAAPGLAGGGRKGARDGSQRLGGALGLRRAAQALGGRRRAACPICRARAAVGAWCPSEERGMGQDIWSPRRGWQPMIQPRAHAPAMGEAPPAPAARSEPWLASLPSKLVANKFAGPGQGHRDAPVSTSATPRRGAAARARPCRRTTSPFPAAELTSAARCRPRAPGLRQAFPSLEGASGPKAPAAKPSRRRCHCHTRENLVTSPHPGRAGWEGVLP